MTGNHLTQCPDTPVIVGEDLQEARNVRQLNAETILMKDTQLVSTLTLPGLISRYRPNISVSRLVHLIYRYEGKCF